MMRTAVLLLFLAGSFAGCTDVDDTRQDEGTGQYPTETAPFRAERDPTLSLILPTWLVGDEWTYELEPPDWQELCKAVPEPHLIVSRDLVVGEGVRHDLPDEPDIYRLRSYLRGCAGETIGERDRDWVKSHLAVLDDEGRWEPKLLFPLEDGKRWRYHPPEGVAVAAEATHVPRYAWNGQEVEAWRIDLESQGAKETFWFGSEAKNVLLRESWRRDGDTFEPFGTLRLVSYRLAS